MRRLLTLAVTASITWALASTFVQRPATGAPASNPPAHDAGAIRDGKALYELRCSSCHGLQLQGTANAPPLLQAGDASVDFWLSTGRMPAAFPYGQQMHKRPQFSKREIVAIVAYVHSRSLGGPPIPRIADGGDLVRGRSSYMANCAACHGAAAQGGSVGYGWVAPPLNAVTPTQIAEAVRTGPSVMPRFGAGVLSDQDVRDIVRYVASLQTDPPDYGGAPLANMGPVAEGLAGWVFGIGSLLLMARLIGSKR
jgi:quinol---cytochrome-c reductase cytochrome c subunit